MGVAQSDWQYHAYNGTAKFADAGPFKELRAVFSVHPEPVTVVARADSGITHVDQLKGKRVNIGNPGSGTRATWEVMEEALGWSRGDLKIATEFKSAEMAQALCDNKIDAYFWLVGHPSASTKEATTSCDSVIVVVTVVPDFGMSIVGQHFPADFAKNAVAAANSRLDAFVAANVPADVEASSMVAHCTIYEEILAAAKDVGADPLVVAAQRPSLGDYLLGPNAARVVRHFRGSVLVVRD